MVNGELLMVSGERSPGGARRASLLGLLLALLLTLPALLPLLRSGFFVSDDGLFHVYRVAALAEAWGQGVLWPRLFPDFGFGYGQAVLNFYAPLSYVPAAVLSVGGMNPATAVQVVIGLSFLLAAAAAFGYGNFLFGPAGGVLAAVVYSYAPYHLADAYLRGAAPEHMAFIFPPLILWAFTAAFWPGRSEGFRYGADAYSTHGAEGFRYGADAYSTHGAEGFRYGADAYSTRGYSRDDLPTIPHSPFTVHRSPFTNPWPPLLWGSLAWVGLVLTHNLTALLMAPVAVLHLLVLAAWTRRWRRLWGAAGALLLAVGLSAFFWLPALVESRAVGLSVGASAGYANHMLTAATWLRRSLAFFLNPAETLGPVFPLSWFALALVAVGGVLALGAALKLPAFRRGGHALDAHAAGSVGDRPEQRGAGSVGDRPEQGGAGSVGDRPEQGGAGSVGDRPEQGGDRPEQRTGVRSDDNVDGVKLPVVAFHLAVAVGAMFMTTAASLFIWQPLTALLGQLQYPWRFLLLEAVGLMGVAAALPALLPRGSRVDRVGVLAVSRVDRVGVLAVSRSALIVAVATLLAMLAALPGLRVEPLPVSAADARLPDRMWAEDAAAGQVGATWTGEFLPLTVAEQRWALGRGRPDALDGAALQPAPSVTLSRLGYAAWTAQVETAEPLTLRLHQFYQPGWRAAVDGRPAALYATGELGLATVDLPPGTHQVEIAFGATPARVAGLLLTLLAAAIWIALAFARGRSRSLQVAGVALGIAVAALALNSLGVGQHTWTPRPVQATLEDVAVLMAADASARPELGVAEVTLYWLALRETSQNFQTFVHLLGPDGAVIAQDDGDPVGGYTPTTRWRPGEIIADRRIIPLPEGLPAGDYGLRAGLYQVEPLRNLTVDPPAADNRVDLGTLTLP